jgi:tetratricopeptide (TPR) repeat protein
MKPLLTITLAALSIIAVAQDNQVLNSINYLKSKELDKAKAAADLAAENEKTKGSPKMWKARGDVYRAIYSDTSAKVRALDEDAEEKALTAYINCLAIDLKENAKDPIYKPDVKGPIVMAANATNRKAGRLGQAKMFDKALAAYNLVESALIYDFDEGMKRNNITKEKLLYNKYDMYGRASDIPKMQEYADKLIAINYKDPKIFINMSNIMLGAKDTTKALYYIEKGKVLFDDNMDLVNSEINIYLARKKTAELKDKLLAAISANDNEILHAILANIYTKTNELDKAEAEYMKALEIKPDYEVANYNLGVVYFNKGNEWSKKAGDLPPKEASKAKEFDAKAVEDWKKAIVYFEKSYEVTPDKATKQRLRQLLLKTGETERAEKYK